MTSFQDFLNAATIFIDPKNPRQYLTGVHIHNDNAVMTDGHIIVICKLTEDVSVFEGKTLSYAYIKNLTGFMKSVPWFIMSECTTEESLIEKTGLVPAYINEKYFDYRRVVHDVPTYTLGGLTATTTNVNSKLAKLLDKFLGKHVKIFWYANDAKDAAATQAENVLIKVMGVRMPETPLPESINFFND